MGRRAVPPFVLDRRYEDIYGNDEERRLVRGICTEWDRLDPDDVARWPEHKTRFYIEWLIERHPEGQGQQQPFDPTKPWAGDAMEFDFAAIGATNVGSGEG